MIGGGIRRPQRNLPLFEQVVNALRIHAPDTAIAFNTTPADSVAAADRWLTSASAS
ncbi:hypothetical protein [Sphingomonas sp. CARO-RG-8B-R24-01]|uniref:hypothetical protein n=1 Tax=Sphingomonas sp. CARO-RG-8B-R24-01 TaxID=2914831 RepID=UPI001F59A48E|nr:hypothetical protein [Sphingomonas sp. CARO-RG-8B-R24-01]